MEKKKEWNIWDIEMARDGGSLFMRIHGAGIEKGVVLDHAVGTKTYGRLTWERRDGVELNENETELLHAAAIRYGSRHLDYAAGILGSKKYGMREMAIV